MTDNPADSEALRRANVVVSVVAPGYGCTGVLLTPTLVLTSSKCLNLAGGWPSIRVGPGGQNGSGLAWHPSSIYGAIGFQPWSGQAPRGNDIALLRLDPRRPVLVDAIIERPSFAPPALTVQGAKLHVTETTGMAGWSPVDDNDQTSPAATVFRQVVMSPTVDLWKKGGYWIRPSASDGLGAGDWGAALFRVRANGARDVFGIGSLVRRDFEQSFVDSIPECSGWKCDGFTDVT